MAIQKLDKPLYHGTSNAASIFIVGGYGFKAPVYLTANKERAIHYAKAATAYLEKICKDEGGKLIAEGYAVFAFHSLPDLKELRTDDYNSNAEPDQFIYQKPIRGLRHFAIERHNLEVDEEEHLRLECFAIGMWRR